MSYITDIEDDEERLPFRVQVKIMRYLLGHFLPAA